MIEPKKKRGTREVLERLAEIGTVLQDLYAERAVFEAEVVGRPVIWDRIKDGGEIEIGNITIKGALYNEADVSKWERLNLPRSTTGKLVKIKIRRTT